MIIDRHNAVMQIVEETISSEKSILQIIKDRECAWSDSKNRVDLQIFNNGTKELWLIDVKTPYNTLKSLEKARKDNETKYIKRKEEA